MPTELMPKPLYSPGMPSCRRILRKASMVPRYLILSISQTAFPGCFCIWSRVLTSVNGCSAKRTQKKNDGP
eukprot:624967-Rhodomonas_salina.3